jgi:hypothetical protein
MTRSAAGCCCYSAALPAGQEILVKALHALCLVLAVQFNQLPLFGVFP